MHVCCWDYRTVPIYALLVITQKEGVYVLTEHSEPKVAMRDWGAVRKDSGNKNRLSHIFQNHCAFALDFLLFRGSGFNFSAWH